MISFILIWIGKQITSLSAPRNLAININQSNKIIFQHCRAWPVRQEVPCVLNGRGDWMKCCLSTSDQILLEFDGKISFSRLLTTFWEKRRGWSSSYVTWTWARLETIICQKKLLPAECFADCKCILRTLARHFMHSEILSSLEEQLCILKYSEEQNTFSHAFKLIVWAFMPTLAQVYWIDVILISSLISVSNYSLKTSY